MSTSPFSKTPKPPGVKPSSPQSMTGRGREGRRREGGRERGREGGREGGGREGERKEEREGEGGGEGGGREHTSYTKLGRLGGVEGSMHVWE